MCMCVGVTLGVCGMCTVYDNGIVIQMCMCMCMCVCVTLGVCWMCIVYDKENPPEYNFSWLKWIPFIGWKRTCESVYDSKCDALLHYERYDMILCYIIMVSDASVNWMHKLGSWHNSCG